MPSYLVALAVGELEARDISPRCAFFVVLVCVVGWFLGRCVIYHHGSHPLCVSPTPTHNMIYERQLPRVGGAVGGGERAVRVRPDRYVRACVRLSLPFILRTRTISRMGINNEPGGRV